MIKKIYYLLKQKKDSFHANAKIRGINFWKGRGKKLFTETGGKIIINGLTTFKENTKLLAKEGGQIQLGEYVKLMENTSIEAIGGGTEFITA